MYVKLKLATVHPTHGYQDKSFNTSEAIEEVRLISVPNHVRRVGTLVSDSDWNSAGKHTKRTKSIVKIRSFLCAPKGRTLKLQTEHLAMDRALCIALIFATSTGVVLGLNCHVCMPPRLSGGSATELLAQQVWEEANETYGPDLVALFAPCTKFNKTDQRYAVRCPFPELKSVCAIISHGTWTARTCQELAEDDDMTCGKESNNLYRCQCDMPLCNTNSPANSLKATFPMATMLVLIAGISCYLYNYI